MNELQVVVKQEVGKINWNFEELKTALATEMKKYTGIVFDDDSIADAKKTVAYLRRERQKREREEAAKREALAKKEEQPQEPEKAPEPVASAEPKTEMGKAIESIERHAYQQAVTGTIANPVTQQPGLSGGKKIWTIQVRGNEEQHKKILDYIKFVGAEYREV